MLQVVTQHSSGDLLDSEQMRLVMDEREGEEQKVESEGERRNRSGAEGEK